MPRRPARLVPLVLLLALLPAGRSSQQPQIEDPLPSWNDGKVKQTLLQFIKDVSDPKNKRYVRPGDRIATFDNDGTLWVEQPMYPEMVFAIDRLKILAREKPELKEKMPFKGILEEDREALDRAALTHGLDLVRLTHDGMSQPEFMGLAREWLATARQPRYHRLYTECVYQPQLELLAYLRTNGFQVWICTGGGLDFLRTFAPQVYKVAPDRIIGSEVLLRYEIKDDKPLLVRTEELTQPFINFAGKPIGIQRFIGRKPILAFGNSDGDQQMLEFADQGEFPRLMLLLRHDDPEREYDYSRQSVVGRLDKALDEAERRDWLVVSFKRDFKRVFSFD